MNTEDLAAAVLRGRRRRRRTEDTESETLRHDNVLLTERLGELEAERDRLHRVSCTLLRLVEELTAERDTARAALEGSW